MSYSVAMKKRWANGENLLKKAHLANKIKGLKNATYIYCVVCGKKKRVPHRKILPKHCSRACYAKTQKGKQLSIDMTPFLPRGKNHYNWKGGNIKTRWPSKKDAKWRKQIFERDNYTCQECGARSGKGKNVYLEGHHIKRKVDYPELIYEIENGITLCKRCHKLTYGKEKKFEKRYYLITKINKMPYNTQHSCRLVKPGLCKKESFKTLKTKTDGLTFISAKLKTTDESVVQSFRYDKSNWSADRARKHCASKDGFFEAAKKTTQTKHLYEMHRKIHSLWNTGEIDKRLLIKIHTSLVKEYAKENMCHWKNDSLDTSITERWNKTLSKNFDIDTVESTPATFEYDLFSKFLACKVKDLFLNSFLIPSPMLGTYLAGFKKVLSEQVLKDTRCFDYSGSEIPPLYEVIKLNSKKSDDFLINGVNFYSSIIVKYQPTFSGLTVALTTSIKNKEWNKKLLDKVHTWVMKHNHLKNEKFALNGEFLSKTNDDWEDLILEDDTKKAIVSATKILKQNIDEAKSRGMLFMGKPGTGKTKTGRVMMNKLDSTFIWVSSKDFINSYGEENPVNLLALSFKLARDLAPTVLFIEDIDMWLGGHTIDLLKTELDGIKENKNIITILTSNNPERLPDALLDRPGRFHDILEFTLPSEEKRKEMVDKWYGKVTENTLKEIIEKTEGFSGAHMKELVDFAITLKKEEDVYTLDSSLLKSLEKILKQRQLIAEIKESESDN